MINRGNGEIICKIRRVKVIQKRCCIWTEGDAKDRQKSNLVSKWLEKFVTDNKHGGSVRGKLSGSLGKR